MLLLGGNASSVHSLLRAYSKLDEQKLIHVPAESFLAQYDGLFRHVRPSRPPALCGIDIDKNTAFLVFHACQALLHP